MIVYGRNPVREALRGRRATQVTEVWAAHGPARDPWLIEAAASAGVRVHTSTPAEIERRCGSSTHQGMCAQAGGYPYVSAGELLAAGRGGAGGEGGGGHGCGGVGGEGGGGPGRGNDGEGDGSRHGRGNKRGGDRDNGDPHPLIIALDEVQDPQNLGSICRTAECAGASGVAICERRAAEITPAVCKASAGAVEHLRVARVRNLADFLGQAREAGCWCYGASSDATVSYDAPDYGGAGVVLVLGSEGRGLRPRVAGACDELVALPLRGRVGSLNVSAVAAVLMYEILQRRDS